MSMVLKDDTIIQSRFENQSRKGSVIQWQPRSAQFLVSHTFAWHCLLMVTVTYLPLFVTLLFRGRPGIWKSHHRLVLGWLVCMQALFPGRKTLEELARWSPAGITAWRFRRVLKAVYWDVHLLVTWWIEKALQTLPPPKDGTLYLVGDGSGKPKGGRRIPVPNKSGKASISRGFSGSDLSY